VTEDVEATDIASIYVLFQYPVLSQTFVRNEIHGLRERGAVVDVLSVEPGDSDHVDADWAGPFRMLQTPRLGRAMLDHIWFALRRPTSYARYLVAVARLREYWRLALRRLPTEARQRSNSVSAGVCHTHFAWDTASVAVYLARLLGIPVSVTLHANDIYLADTRRLRTRLRHFDRLVTVCNFNVGLLNGLGVSEVGDGDVDVVPCGVAVPAQLESEMRVITTDVISVGRLIEKKGFDTLIRSIALARTTRPDIRATIVGDGPERSTLERLVAELGLEPNVAFAGALTHQAALELIDGAKIFCLACQRDRSGDCDAVPVVIREAMARGIPVISTRVAGVPEVVDGEVGWLVDPRSPTALASAITAALKDDEERTARGRVGRQRVLHRWTIEAQATGILRAFERMTAR
jgi:colanic acid/amylovoran biosynthesis glycosyltransferase